MNKVEVRLVHAKLLCKAIQQSSKLSLKYLWSVVSSTISLITYLGFAQIPKYDQWFACLSQTIQSHLSKFGDESLFVLRSENKCRPQRNRLQCYLFSVVQQSYNLSLRKNKFFVFGLKQVKCGFVHRRTET